MYQRCAPRHPRSIRRTEIRRKQSDSGVVDEEKKEGIGEGTSTRRLRERNFTKFTRRRKQEDADDDDDDDDGDGGTGRPRLCRKFPVDVDPVGDIE